MNKLFLIMVLTLVVISCGKQGFVENEQYSKPNADFDLDGKSNQDELNDGENPYVNNSVVDNYLGDSNTVLKVRLRTNKDYREELRFFNLDKSIKFFNEKAFLKPTFKSLYALKKNINLEEKSTDPEIFYKNVLACVSRGQLGSLKVKYKDFVLGDVDIISDLLKLKDNLDTKFYIYDFSTLEDIYFFENNRGGKSHYKSHRFTIDYDKLNKDFCILYDNPRKDYSNLSPAFKLNNGELEKNFIVAKYLRGMALNSSLRLNGYEQKNKIFFKRNKIKFEKYTFPSTKEILDSKGIDRLMIGDSVTVLRYIASNIRYTAQLVERSPLYRRYTDEEGSRQILAGHCAYFEKPKVRDVKQYKDISNIKLEDLSLDIGGQKILPIEVIGYHARYQFIVNENMIVNDRVKIKLKNKTSTKFEFESIFYPKFDGGQGTCPKARRSSYYSDFKDLTNTIIVEKN